MKAFNESQLAANAKASQDLNRQANDATVSMAVAGIAATLLAGAFAAWMTTFKVARPLSRMVERMKALAGGDLGVEIEGLAAATKSAKWPRRSRCSRPTPLSGCKWRGTPPSIAPPLTPRASGSRPRRLGPQISSREPCVHSARACSVLPMAT